MTRMRTPPHTKWKPVFEILFWQVSISYPFSCDFDSQYLAATTPAASPTATSPTAASEASTTTTAAAAETSTATTEAAARSHAGGTTIAVAARIGSVESPGTTSECIPVTCATARKITTAYAIGSARRTGATDAIRATNPSCAVTGAGVPRIAAETSTRGRLARELSALSTNLLPRTGLALGQ